MDADADVLDGDAQRLVGQRDQFGRKGAVRGGDGAAHSVDASVRSPLNGPLTRVQNTVGSKVSSLSPDSRSVSTTPIDTVAIGPDTGTTSRPALGSGPSTIPATR